MSSTVATTSIRMKSGVENCCRSVERPVVAGTSPRRSGMRSGCCPGAAGLVISGSRTSRPADDRRRLLRAPIGAAAAPPPSARNSSRSIPSASLRWTASRWLHHHRHEEVCRASDFETEEFRARSRRRSGKGVPVKRDGASNDAMVAGKPALPVVVAEHGDRMPVWTFIVLGLQRATIGRFHSEESEEIPVHHLRFCRWL